MPCKQRMHSLSVHSGLSSVLTLSRNVGAPKLEKVMAVSNRLCSSSVFPIHSYSEFLSQPSRARYPSAIRKLQPYAKIQGMISLGSGNANPACFPIHAATLSLHKDQTLAIPALQEALQYSATRGLPSLLSYLNEQLTLEHSPKSSIKPEILITNGSQQALTMAFEMLLTPGDIIFVESPTYSGALAFLEPFGAYIIDIPCDSEGMHLESFEEKLQIERNKGRNARILYTIPTGTNPSGKCTSILRKKALYHLAQKYNLLILEDDPYYYLQFDTQWIPSYMSIDTDGRVLRFDSFSKIICPGLRLGYVSGPPSLIERLELHMQATALHASGISQAFLLAILTHWKTFDGFDRHVQTVCQTYKAKRDMFINLLNIHLKDKVYFELPMAGMFVWMHVLGISNTQPLVDSAIHENKILLVPGTAFYAGNRDSSHIRASFSIASEQEMDEGLRRLSYAIDTFHSKK